MDGQRFAPFSSEKKEYCDACLWSHGHFPSNMSSMPVYGRTVVNLLQNDNVSRSVLLLPNIINS
jgi:hypothetical protein